MGKCAHVTELQLQPRPAIIDEAGEMVERLNAFHTSKAKYLALVEKAVSEGRNPDDVVKPKGTRNPLLLKLWSLLRLGRQAKIFVITATNDLTSTSSPARPAATWWPASRWGADRDRRGLTCAPSVAYSSGSR